MKSLSATLSVKQTLRYKLLFNIVLIFGRMRLLNLKKAIAVLNYIRPYGAFKYRVNKGKWRKLEMPELGLEGDSDEF